MTFHYRIFVVFDKISKGMLVTIEKELGEYFQRLHFWNQWVPLIKMHCRVRYLLDFDLKMIQRYLKEIKAAHEIRNSTPENISTSLCPKFPVSVSGRKNAKLEWVLWMTSPPVTITSCLFGQLHYETHCTYPVVSWYVSTYSRAARVDFRQIDCHTIAFPPLPLPSFPKSFLNQDSSVLFPSSFYYV